MPVQFAVTLFVSASLLFMVQPMIGRMVLPLLGGSPAAWNTCMVFFQIVLLLGYFYAHKLTEKLPPRRQVGLHAAVLLAAIGTFALAVVLSDRHSPIAVVKSLAPQSTSYPMFGVLALLLVAIGVPFFAVSTSAPLLQRWFAYTGHRASRDPYFLYAASNAGSLLSLLAYPILVEPSLTLAGQAWLFAGGFAGLTALIVLCGRLVPDAEAKGKPLAEPPPAAPPTWKQKVRWTALAFVPSSLMLGVTFHMTTDIASIPLLWVGPLALYLLTFIIAFSRLPSWFRPVIGNVSPVVTLLLVFVLTSQTTIDNVFFSLGLHLLAYFLAALMCHTELAHARPADVRHLTNYYLWISVGGMLGGVFNALVAPVALPLAYEYPIAIAVGCMMVPKADEDRPADDGRRALAGMLDYVVPLGMLAAVAGLTLLPNYDWYNAAAGWVAGKASAAAQFARLPLLLRKENVDLLVVFALPAMACFFFIDRPVRFGLCAAAILFVGYYRARESYVVRTERSFFGILKVEEVGHYRRLVHGTTLHGTQAADTPLSDYDRVMPFGAMNQWDALIVQGAVLAWNFREEPLTYYHRTGPVGHMFHHLARTRPTAPVAMVGLGTGSVSCYARAGQPLTFYEIDPTVKRLVADDDRYFSYYRDAQRRGADMSIVLGDARLKLEESDAKYRLLLVDAFSSDSIPVHLLTEEAVALYLNRVTDDGVVALHISNKFVSLEYVLDQIVRKLGVSALVFNDGWTERGHMAQSAPPGKTASSWVVVARRPEAIEPFKDPVYTTRYRYKESNEEPPVHAWKPLKHDDNVRPWTDDYADVLSVMMIREIQQFRHAIGLPTVAELRE